MPHNESGAVDEFLNGLDNEPKEDVFKTEVPADPFSGKKEEAVKEEVEEKLPFNKDPKIQKFIAKEVAKQVAEIQPTATETFVRETNTEATEDEMSAVLTRIIGNDTPEKVAAIKDFKKVLSGLEEKGAQKALAQLRDQAVQQQQEEQEAQQELASGFENIEETFGVDLTSDSPKAKKERSDFVDFIRRVAPKDRDGEVVEFPDLEETYKLFSESKKPESNDRAKQLASRGLQRSGDASNTQVTGDRSWKAVDKIFDRLTK